MSEPQPAAPQQGFQMQPFQFEIPMIGRGPDGKPVLALVITRLPLGERLLQPIAIEDAKVFRAKLDEAIRQAETGITSASPLDMQALLKQHWNPNGSHGG